MKEEKASRLSVTLGLGEMDKLHITVKRKVFSRFSSFLLLISYFFFMVVLVDFLGGCRRFSLFRSSWKYPLLAMTFFGSCFQNSRFVLLPSFLEDPP
jgi:hypothetical protein